MITKSQAASPWIKILNQFSAQYEQSLTVVLAEELVGENRPKPPKPYVSVKIISGPLASGSSEDLRTSAEGFTLSSLRQFVVSLQAFGQGAYDSLSLFHTLLYADTFVLDDGSIFFMDNLKKDGVAVVDRGEVTDITGLLNTGFETRSSLDITFNMASNQEVPISTIDKVTVSGKLKDDMNNERDLTEEVEKP